MILVVNVSFISSTVFDERKKKVNRAEWMERRKKEKSLHRKVKFPFIIRARREKPEIQEIEERVRHEVHKNQQSTVRNL